MADKIPSELRALVADVDRLMRRVVADTASGEPCTKKLFGALAASMHERRTRAAASLADTWRQARALIALGNVPTPEARRGAFAFRADALQLVQVLDDERLRCTKDYLQPAASLSPTVAGDDDEWVGDDAPKPLEIQTGLYFGDAVAYCPQTGHIAIEPLRTQAAKLARAGHLEEGLSGDLIDALESLHLGDDLILEAGDDVIGDDVIEVGRGKVAKKLKKVAKKSVTKIAKAAKTVAKSRLGKVIKTAVAMSNPAAAVSMKALSKGAKVAKKAKSKPKTAAQAKSQAKAKTTVKLAEKKNKGQLSTKQTKAAAKKKGIAHTDIAQTSQALTVVDAAEAGDPTAQAALATHTQVETATEAPLDPQAFAPDESASESPDGYTEPEDDSMPESEPTESYFDEGEEMPADEEETSDEESESEDE